MLQMSVRHDHGFGVTRGLMSSAPPSDDLRRWLAGRWALLFSHPDDFASYGFEADRWLVYMQNLFDSLRLRPMAVGHDDGSGWISQIGGRFVPGYQVHGLVPQLRESARFQTGQSEPEHFVTILDGSANARRTLLYRPGSRNPSVVELAQTAVHLRERGAPKSVRRILQGV